MKHRALHRWMRGSFAFVAAHPMAVLGYPKHMQLRASIGLGLACLLIAGCGEDGGDAGGNTGGSSGAGAGGGRGGSAAGGGGGAAGSGGGAAGMAGSGGSLGGAAGSGGTAGSGSALAPIFVGIGDFERTVMSCDYGQTWIENTSTDDSARCYGNNNMPDCDHSGETGKGITHTGEQFVATFGWGPPGRILRSPDGVNWTETQAGDTYGGVASDGAGHVVAGSRDARYSTDHGATWSEPAMNVLQTTYNVREIVYSSYGGGRYVLVSSDGSDSEVVVSSDGGMTYVAPTTVGPNCGARNRLAANDAVILLMGGDGKYCRSVDGGDTFTEGEVESGTDAGIRSSVVWTGSHFKTWARGKLYQSTDGAAWTSQPTAPADLPVGVVASSDDGKLVAVRDGWKQWYDDQRFYRSDDGVTWTELDASAAPRSHRIREITFAWATPSANCPAR